MIEVEPDKKEMPATLGEYCDAVPASLRNQKVRGVIIIYANEGSGIAQMLTGDVDTEDAIEIMRGIVDNPEGGRATCIPGMH